MSIFNFMKSQNAAHSLVLKDKFGESIPAIDSSNYAEKRSREHTIFTSYFGQFCSKSAQALVKDRQDLFSSPSSNEDVNS